MFDLLWDTQALLESRGTWLLGLTTVPLSCLPVCLSPVPCPFLICTGGNPVKPVMACDFRAGMRWGCSSWKPASPLDLSARANLVPLNHSSWWTPHCLNLRPVRMPLTLPPLWTVRGGACSHSPVVITSGQLRVTILKSFHQLSHKSDVFTNTFSAHNSLLT